MAELKNIPQMTYTYYVCMQREGNDPGTWQRPKYTFNKQNTGPFQAELQGAYGDPCCHCPTAPPPYDANRRTE